MVYRLFPSSIHFWRTAEANRCLRSYGRTLGSNLLSRLGFASFQHFWNKLVSCSPVMEVPFVWVIFAAADVLEKRGDPFFAETAGFIFRLIYTCGLRPQEARKLQCADINFKTGEIFIFHIESILWLKTTWVSWYMDEIRCNKHQIWVSAFHGHLKNQAIWLILLDSGFQILTGSTGK